MRAFILPYTAKRLLHVAALSRRGIHVLRELGIFIVCHSHGENYHASNCIVYHVTKSSKKMVISYSGPQWRFAHFLSTFPQSPSSFLSMVPFRRCADFLLVHFFNAASFALFLYSSNYCYCYFVHGSIALWRLPCLTH